jgi:hypothetical protein
MVKSPLTPTEKSSMRRTFTGPVLKYSARLAIAAVNWRLGACRVEYERQLPTPHH